MLARRAADKTAWVAAKLSLAGYEILANASGSSATSPASAGGAPLIDRCEVGLDALVKCITAFQRDELAVRSCLLEEIQAGTACERFAF